MVLTIECTNCDETVERYASDIEGVENVFCSKQCHDEWQRTNAPTDDNAPGWKGGQKIVTCDWCGQEYSDYPSRIDRKDGTYCSQECYGKSREKSPDIDCHWCGDSVEGMPANFRRSERSFCSTECHSEWMSDYMSGPDGPRWRGGESYHPRNYGPNWDEQREKAIERDGHRCMLCDSTNDLVVHHKRPLRTFDRDKHRWWDRANDLRNLITLCRSCHSVVHSNREQYFPDYYNEGEI